MVIFNRTKNLTIKKEYLELNNLKKRKTSFRIKNLQPQLLRIIQSNTSQPYIFKSKFRITMVPSSNLHIFLSSPVMKWPLTVNLLSFEKKPLGLHTTQFYTFSR